MRRITTDKRIQPNERTERGPCGECGRRHIHKDDCPTLLKRLDRTFESLSRHEQIENFVRLSHDGRTL